MRRGTFPIFTSVVVALVAEGAAAQRATVSVPRACAGQAPHVRITGDRTGTVKVRTRVERLDGSVVHLPALVVAIPSATFETPALPGDCGGGTLFVEVVDVATGDRISTTGSPIGY